MSTRIALAFALAVALAGCEFDSSGSVRDGDDDSIAADAAVATPDAATPAPDATVPPPPPDAGTDTLGCNWDQVCDPDEDPTWCWDCGDGGGFECNFDQHCDRDEDSNCPDCF